MVVQTITQEYFASKPGKYLIPDFDISVNGVKYNSAGKTVTFSLEVAQNEDDSSEEKSSDFKDIYLDNSDVFFSVQPDRESVYIREGFSVKISLYIAESAPVEMEFYQFNLQLQSILKKIRPANCWEENIGIEEIVKRNVTIKGRRYSEYNMYQAHFFPITLQNVVFPAVNLDMLVMENKNAVNVESKSVKSFFSKKITIAVKPLPAHPLKDQVAVGQYHLVEKLSSNLVYPGESIRYSFKIVGIGNITAIPTPEIEANSNLDFYPPEISQVTRRSVARISGEKTFDYFVVPRRDGTFPLGRYFQWVYFDPGSAKYDTLRSEEILQVKGEEYKLGNISLSGSLGLYDNIDRLSTTQKNFSYKSFFKDVTNVVAIILVIATIWIFRK